MEFEPGAGVFYLEHNQTKEMDPTMMNRNISCAVCEKYREDVEGSLKWCKGCEGVAYCSRECQKAHWPKHKPQCKTLQDQLLFLDLVRRALEDPKILHYLRVAIVIDGKLLSDPPYKRGLMRRTVTFQVALDPDEQLGSKIRNRLLGEMFLQKERPEYMILPSPDALEEAKDAEGYFHFSSGLACGLGGGDHDGKSLWELSKRTQKSGFFGEGERTEDELKRYEGHMGVERARNPVVVVEWFWNLYAAKNALEITPEAFRDAQRGHIHKSMRFVFPGEEESELGQYPIKRLKGRCGLLSDINQYIKSNKSLNLKAKLSAFDKQLAMDRCKIALENVQKKLDKDPNYLRERKYES